MNPLDTLNTENVETPEKAPLPVGKSAVPKGPYALPTGGTPTGVDPGLLENMQKLIAEREAQKNSFFETMKDAQAWWSGGAAGPSEALSRRSKEREEQEATTFGMKSQLAQYNAQQALAQRKQKDVLGALNGTGGGGAPGGNPFNVQIDPLIAQQIRDLAQTNPDAAAKLLQDNTKDLSKILTTARTNPKSYEKTIEIRTPSGKLDNVSLVELLSSPQKYQPTETGANTARQLISTETTGNAKTVANAEIAAKVFGVPFISGNRSNDQQWELYDAWVASGRKGNPVARPGTSRHEKGEALDVDMSKATDKHIAWLKDNGYYQPDWATNKASGKYDPNHWELQPTTTATTTAPTTTTRAPIKPITEKTIPELRAEQEITNTYQKTSADQYAKNVMDEEKAFRASTESKSIAERKTSAERVVSLVQQYPQSVGILAKEGVVKALQTIARDGINTPSGAVGVRTIEDALVLTMPGTSPAVISARKEIAQNLARGALEASKLSQGQGSVSDFERSMFEKIAGSLADTPDLLIKRQNMLIARAELDQQLGAMYRQIKVPGKPADFEAFKSREDVASLIDKYEEKLRSIQNGQGSTSGKTPSGIQFKVITPPAKT